MEAWFAGVCERIGVVSGTTANIACVVVAVLLITLIVLGFGPLRAWLAGSTPKWTRRVPLIGHEDSLLDIWRLYLHVTRPRLQRR